MDNKDYLKEANPLILDWVNMSGPLGRILSHNKPFVTVLNCFVAYKEGIELTPTENDSEIEKLELLNLSLRRQAALIDSEYTPEYVIENSPRTDFIDICSYIYSHLGSFDFQNLISKVESDLSSEFKELFKSKYIEIIEVYRLLFTKLICLYIDLHKFKGDKENYGLKFNQLIKHLSDIRDLNIKLINYFTDYHLLINPFKGIELVFIALINDLLDQNNSIL